MMKYLTTLICISLLSGCAATVSMEELEAAALRSGDWTEVEKRERRLARRKQNHLRKCPHGSTNVCTKKVVDTVCQCVSSSTVRQMLTGRRW